MNLNISKFFREAAPMDYSASVSEIGTDAGRATWRAACDDSADYPLLDTDEKREAFRAFVLSSGGWLEEEIERWSDLELNALCIQWVAGDMREAGLTCDATADDWDQYGRDATDGRVSSRLWRSDDGDVFFGISE